MKFRWQVFFLSFFLALLTSLLGAEAVEISPEMGKKIETCIRHSKVSEKQAFLVIKNPQDPSDFMAYSRLDCDHTAEDPKLAAHLFDFATQSATHTATADFVTSASTDTSKIAAFDPSAVVTEGRVEEFLPFSYCEKNLKAETVTCHFFIQHLFPSELLRILSRKENEKIFLNIQDCMKKSTVGMLAFSPIPETGSAQRLAESSCDDGPAADLYEKLYKAHDLRKWISLPDNDSGPKIKMLLPDEDALFSNMLYCDRSERFGEDAGFDHFCKIPGAVNINSKYTDANYDEVVRSSGSPKKKP